MKYSISLVFIFCLFALADSAISAESRFDTTEISQRLESSSKTLLKQLPKEGKIQFLAAHEAWISFRDYSCVLERNLRPISGTDEPTSRELELVEEKCLYDATKGRLAAVTQYLAAIQPQNNAVPGRLVKDNSLQINRAELLTKNKISFTIWPSSFLDEDQKPGDFRTEFILGTHEGAYISTRFFNLTGKHTITLKWYSPVGSMSSEIPYEHEFTQKNTGIWHKLEIDKNMATGDWLLDLVVDGKILATKKITLLP